MNSWLTVSQPLAKAKCRLWFHWCRPRGRSGGGQEGGDVDAVSSGDAASVPPGPWSGGAPARLQDFFKEALSNDLAFSERQIVTFLTLKSHR